MNEQLNLYMITRTNDGQINELPHTGAKAIIALLIKVRLNELTKLRKPLKNDGMNKWMNE